MEIIDSLASSPLAALKKTQAIVAPDAAATQQFAALMQAPAVDAASLAPAAAASAAVNNVSVGDKILNGMQRMSTDLRDSWNKISDSLRPESAELSMQQTLGLQLQLSVATVQADMLGKVTSRSTQNFDQLVRMQ